jgi:hypothetical protein
MATKKTAESGILRCHECGTELAFTIDVYWVRAGGKPLAHCKACAKKAWADPDYASKG